MLYRRFGRTGLLLPVFSCGGMRFMQSWDDLRQGQIQAASQRNLEETLRRSLALGITHLETASAYGSSELQMGPLLRQLRRDSFILQTKIMPMADAAAFEQTLERSYRLLGVERFDLVSVHGINLEEQLDWTLRPGGCLDVLRRHQRAGRIGHIGFSTHAFTELILQAIASDAFDYINLHWYYFNRRNEACVAAASARDMGIFIISPNDKGGRLYDPPAKLTQLCRDFHPMAFNDLYCLSDPRVHTLSIGAARPTDFDIHAEALRHLDDPQLPARLHAIDTAIQAALRQEHGPEWMASYDRGLPAIEATPARVNISDILRFWTLAKGLDMHAFAKMRYQLLGKKNHWFQGEQATGFSDAAMLAALRQSPFPERVLAALRESHALFREDA